MQKGDIADFLERRELLQQALAATILNDTRRQLDAELSFVMSQIRRLEREAQRAAASHK